MFEAFGQGFVMAMRVDTFLMIAFGLFSGMLVGALPGLTTTLAMAVLLPISFFLDPLLGIPFLIGVYKGGIYGGSIPAILVSIPGTGAAIATTFDGPALTKQGKARKGLEIALYSSVVADFSTDIMTILFIGPIAYLALKIGPPEVFAVILFSLVILSTVAGGSSVKGGIMGMLGLLLAMVGQDPLNAVSRFTFGVFELRAGITLIPMMIGLFAIPEILIALESRASSFVSEKVDLSKVGERLTFAEFRRCLRTIGRSTLIGAGLGATPGVGQVVAAFVGYGSAKRASKHPETFGKGELEGVAAAEAANNAVNGPTLVPLLTLGIPGDNVTAILLGAFVAQGLRPGPQMFQEQAPLIYAILVAMVLANGLFFLMGYGLLGFFARIITMRKSALLPIIMAFAFVGTYVFRSDFFDLKVMFIFGILGYLCRKLHFDIAPLIIAFILEPILEYSFGQTLLLAKGHLLWYLFIQRPIACGFLILSGIVIFYTARGRGLMKRAAVLERAPEI
ncbi:MAG: tripartite tricarboxylate transporter permease [Nitrospinota bacterium]